MLHIRKADPPNELRHAQATQTLYESLPTLQPLRERLVAEQRGLCVFCMRRIEPSDASMKIAHFVPRSVEPERSTDWRNMFGACLGRQNDRRYQLQRGPRFPAHRETCDTRQGDAILDSRLDPVRPEIESRFTYRSDGTMVCVDPSTGEADETLSVVVGVAVGDAVTTNRGLLNLNDSALRRARADTMRAYKRRLQERSRGTWSTNILEAELRRIDRAGLLPEYFGAVKYQIEHRLGLRPPPPR
jgi:uncharacterized protein (TIGR02646 family)